MMMNFEHISYQYKAIIFRHVLLFQQLRLL
jgi:hypothetical protein